MAIAKENLPHAGLETDEDDFARTPSTPVSPAELREVLEQHGERFKPILAALRDQPWKELVTSRDLMDTLSAQGLEQSERTLRLHLAEMAEAGLIQRHGRRGYRLTEAGTEVTRELTVSRRIGSILYRMEETACQLTFDLSRRQGLVSINAYVIPQTLISPLINEVEAVFKAGLAVGQHVLFALPGDDILGREVPEGHIGLGTMCSLTLASMLMRRGVPTHAIFGGLLHVENGKPEHFLEMIRYDATSLSPNEVFIRANLTSVSAAAKRGIGAITASFRELPMSALPAARAVMKECEQAEFPGIMCLGRPGQPLLNIPVHEGRVGMIFSTGLNPLASLWEHDRSAPNRGMPGLLLESSRPMVGPAPYEQLISYQEFCQRAAAFIAHRHLQHQRHPHASLTPSSSTLHQ
jgi:HTH-type transcriptional regulator, global nitrogen regulator NrpRI